MICSAKPKHLMDHVIPEHVLHRSCARTCEMGLGCVRAHRIAIMNSVGSQQTKTLCLRSLNGPAA